MATKIKVTLDGSSAAWMDVFKNSPEIREGLARYAKAAASRNTSALQASGARGVKQEHGFVAIVDTADKTALGKVVANSSAARSAAKKAGLPRW